jgi:hypothetical protein
MIRSFVLRLDEQIRSGRLDATLPTDVVSDKNCRQRRCQNGPAGAEPGAQLQVFQEVVVMAMPYCPWQFKARCDI